MDSITNLHLCLIVNTLAGIMLKTILLYGLLLGLLVFTLHFIEYFFWVRMHIFEIYAGLIACLFLALGLWFGRKTPLRSVDRPTLSNGCRPDRERTPQRGFEQKSNMDFSKLGISKREYDVLLLINEGMSNQEIADKLFVSMNTVKTHTSRLFEKLAVKNQTQAILKSKELEIISG